MKFDDENMEEIVCTPLLPLLLFGYRIVSEISTALTPRQSTFLGSATASERFHTARQSGFSLLLQ